jgi:membrane protein
MRAPGRDRAVAKTDEDRDGRTDGRDEQPGDHPEHPVQLGVRGWWGAIRRTIKEFQTDNLSDWAAALTYYGVLSLFPGLLVLISVLGLTGDEAVNTLKDNITEGTPENVATLLTQAIDNLAATKPSTASLLALVGIATALWSASAYVAAFMRASNAIYDVPEGRPIWKTLPLRVAVTVLMMVLLAVTAFAVVLTGGLADRIGEYLGLGSTVVTVWDLAKWPVLLVVVSFMFGVLYWASPNAKQGFRWVTPGGALAVLVWVVVSGGFAVYLGNFDSYDKTYGTFAGIIIFLIWLWISNIAILLGAELNAELERGRHIVAGHPADEEPYIELRDTSKLKERDAL